MVYGPAFGLANSGYAMYMGSHALDGNGSTAEKVAAQRVFFNYMLFATTIKSLKFTSVTVPPTFSSNDTRTVSVTVSSGNPTYSYQWTSTVSGGSFANANSATTTYTTPTTPVLIKGVLTCQVTDACGRKNFIQRPIVIDPSALPVNLLSFTAYADKMNKVKLSWITSSEKDNDYFTIERSSDGRNFTELKKIAGAGTTNEIKKYYLTDENPVKGTSYYLLRQTDYNGKSETFKTIAVSIKASSVNNISIYPNPFITFFTAEFNAVDDEVVQIQLIGLDGSLIHSDKFEAVMGRNAYRFMPEEPLKPGTYILRLSNGKEVFGAVKVNSRNN